MNNIDDAIILVIAYRKFLLELGQMFSDVKDSEAYGGFADNFIDFCKSPEIGFNPAEAEALIKMYHKFCLLDIVDLPSHHAMKIMATKDVDMDLLESAKTLTTTDFKESLKDKSLGTQDRTYKYEVIKRAVETGSIKKVYGEELEEAIKQLNHESV